METIVLFNQRFESGTAGEIACAIDALSHDGSKTYVVAAINVYLVTLCNRSEELSQFYNEDCDIVTVDGRPLVYSSHLLSKYPFPEMVGGPNLWNILLAQGASKNQSFFFLGSTDEILQKASNALRDAYPGINIVGTHNGFFDPDGPEFEIIASQIAALSPSYILIGISSPKKEYIAKKLRNRLRGGVIVLIGGAFDYLAGEKKIGSAWVSLLCLDWFFRMMQEPKRLFPRYLKSNLEFLFLLSKSILRLALGKEKG